MVKLPDLFVNIKKDSISLKLTISYFRGRIQCSYIESYIDENRFNRFQKICPDKCYSRKLSY